MNLTSVDEPFASTFPKAIKTPFPELVDPSWCDEPTVQMTAEEVKQLLALTLRPSSSSVTVPAMKAVVVPAAYPSSRPSLNTHYVLSEMGDEPMADSIRGAAL